MEIMKNKWTWIILGIILLVLLMRHNKMTLSSLFGASDNFTPTGDEKESSNNKNS